MKKMILGIIGSFPPPLGGCTILLKQLYDGLVFDQELNVLIVNTSNKNKFSVSALWRTMCELTTFILRCDIFTLHAGRKGAFYGGAILKVFSRILRRPYVLRYFGGSIELDYLRLKGLSRHVFRFAVNADALFVETKAAVSFCENILGINAVWFPNSRPIEDELPNCSARSPVKFIFIGHVKPSKGVYELISAARYFGEHQCLVDVYGPLQEGVISEDFSGINNLRYCGQIDSKSVSSALRSHDVLILPTYYIGEGYPGVILEAYANGRPVISTNWRSIPEILSIETGTIIPPKSVEGLVSAMRKYIESPELIDKQSKSCSALILQFSSSYWNEFFKKKCLTLVKGKA